MKTKNKLSKVQFINEDDYFIIDHTKNLKAKVLALLKSKKIDWDADCILISLRPISLRLQRFRLEKRKGFCKIIRFWVDRVRRP